ncbi:MAG: glycine-rich domain-containing protein-like [Cyanobacteria bacterium SBLK]|nr:glycine-rich domain-containing protein-like [Cyanobacteria bacterium SBLK]
MNLEDLSEQDRKFLEELKATDFEPIAYKLMNPDEGKGLTLEETISAIEQYRRFLILKHFYPDRGIVPTREIDKAWHCHILDTVKYREDCQRLFGEVLEHFPYFGLRGEDDQKRLQQFFSESQSLFEKNFRSNHQIIFKLILPRAFFLFYLGLCCS